MIEKRLKLDKVARSIFPFDEDHQQYNSVTLMLAAIIKVPSRQQVYTQTPSFGDEKGNVSTPLHHPIHLKITHTHTSTLICLGDDP
jgi:hypothetical protein